MFFFITSKNWNIRTFFWTNENVKNISYQFETIELNFYFFIFFIKTVSSSTVDTSRTFSWQLFKHERNAQITNTHRYFRTGPSWKWSAAPAAEELQSWTWWSFLVSENWWTWPKEQLKWNPAIPILPETSACIANVWCSRWLFWKKMI